MNGSKVIFALCLSSVSIVAAAANAKQSPERAAESQCVHFDVKAGAGVEAADVSARRGMNNPHLALQYALHRSSHYLYNPGQGEWIARAMVEQTVKQQ